jgi:MFS family permease
LTDAPPKLAKPHGLIGTFKMLSPAARVLVINQFFISLGFTMVVPFLAIYLTKDLAMATALVGLIIGLRSFSSMGMFLVGGTLADRMGARPTIILGCMLRIMGFGLFALSASLPAIVIATLLTGLSAAFFTPAGRSYLTAETAGHRAEAFGLFAVLGNAGNLIGPVIGGLLIAVDFRIVSASACIIFVILALIQVMFLPNRVMEKRVSTLLQDLTQVVRNRRFLVFSIAGALYTMSSLQVTFAMALEAHRVTGRDDSVTLLFIASALCGMAIQVRVTRWCRANMTSGQSLGLGFVLAGLCWIPIILAGPFVPTHHTPLPIPQAALWMLPVILSAMILAAGNAMGQPFTMELMPVVGSEKMIGTYYGYFSLITGLSAAIGNAAIGAMMRPEIPYLRWMPFVMLMVCSLAGAAVLKGMQKRGQLEPQAAD